MATPLLNVLDVFGTGSTTTTGSGNTITISLTGLTNHNVLVGAGTATVTKVDPTGVSSGVPLISQGAGADPLFGTATVPGGGTGDTSFTAFAPITGGTTSTGALQQATTGFGTAGFVLTSTGSGSLPTWQAVSSPGAVTSINVDTTTGGGTNPVLPSAGAITMTGGQYATGTFGSRVVTINSAAANSLTVDVQISSAVGASNTTKNGLAHFNSSLFTVDANGFVSSAGTGFVQTLTGNSGGAISPTANNINTVGTGSITIAGAGSTLTTQLTGLTNHAIQIGAGTATLTQLGAGTTGQVLQTNTGADPTWSTATYPSTTTINQILYSSSANTVAGLATTNSASLATTSAGVPQWLAMTDGQLVVGSTAGQPAAATLTAGTGITITNASNSITISASSSGFSWTDVTGATQTIAAENGYITDRGGGVTYTLPASGSLGDTFKIVGKTGLATITPLALQQLCVGATSGTVGVTGTCVSNNAGDCIEFVCITSGASTVWRATNMIGTWTQN